MDFTAVFTTIGAAFVLVFASIGVSTTYQFAKIGLRQIRNIAEDISAVDAAMTRPRKDLR